MEIVFSSNSEHSRQALLDYVRAHKAKELRFRVVDIGGAGNPWTASIVDAYADLRQVSGAQTIMGDINDPETWQRIRSEKFDFCICSHTLEDLRDPLFVLSELQRSFRHGYIAVPNKHVEFSHIQSLHYVGYGHHRWIFTLTPTELRVIAKWPFASYFSPRRRWIAQIKASAAAGFLRNLLGRKGGLSAIGPLPWWHSELAGPNHELAFIWKGELQFSSINQDYAGDSILALAKLYRDELAQGL